MVRNIGLRGHARTPISFSATITSAVASRSTNCVGGRLRGVINLRARTPLGHTLVPFNNVGVVRNSYGTCGHRLSPVVGGVFARCHGARGRNIFSICAPSVLHYHGSNILANLPSTCNHNHVVNSCHHITLCNVSCLVGSGLTRFASLRTSLRGNMGLRRAVHLHRRVTRRRHTLNRVGRVTTGCNCSVSNPTAGTRRTVR